MSVSISSIALCLVAAASPFCCAASEGATLPITATTPVVSGPDEIGFSSSALPDAPGRGTNVEFFGGSDRPTATLTRARMRPFSKLGIALKVGSSGAGFEVATPLAEKFNLRAGASFINYNPNLLEDGITVNGTLSFKSAMASLDWYPFGGSFRISPGIVMYNGNHLSATAFVPGGQTFTLNDTDYTSDPTGIDPAHGAFNIAFGNKAAPSLTMGFGNIISRKEGKHWSVPFEIGAEFTSKPVLTLSLAGTACSSEGCGSLTDPENQANIAAEQKQYNDDLAPLRFWPIVSIGVGYKF